MTSLLCDQQEKEREVDAPAHGSKAESDSSTARWHPHSLVVAVQVLGECSSSGDRSVRGARGARVRARERYGSSRVHGFTPENTAFQSQKVLP